MLTGDRERALQQSISKHGGNGKVPKLDALRHCVGCKVLLSGHNPVFEFVTHVRVITPAVVIGSKPKMHVGQPVIGQFCQSCGQKLMPYVPDGLRQMYDFILANVQTAEAAKEAEDAVGELDDDAEAPGGGLILP